MPTTCAELRILATWGSGAAIGVKAPASQTMIVSNPAGVAGVGIDVQERLLWRIELPEVVVSPTLNQAIRPKPACVVVAERDFCEWTRRRLERTGAVNFT